MFKKSSDQQQPSKLSQFEDASMTNNQEEATQGGYYDWSNMYAAPSRMTTADPAPINNRSSRNNIGPVDEAENFIRCTIDTALGRSW